MELFNNDIITPGMKKEKKKKNSEGMKTDSLLRETTSHYLRLIGDADRKARIMIVVNSILLTISVTILTKYIDNSPYIWISAMLLACANLITLFFAVISVKPELHTPIEKETEDNMLHYKKCIEYSLPDYTKHMLETMQDDDKKMDAVIKDMYFFGNLLGTKYRLLKIAYRFFFWGIMLSVTSYLVILFLRKLFLSQ